VSGIVEVWRASQLSREARRRLFERRLQAEALLSRVREVIEDVKARGDEAIRDFYESFYRIPRDTPIVIGEEEFEEALSKVSSRLTEALEEAASRIKEVASRQLPPSLVLYDVSGALVGVAWRPVESVGVYVPGGGAAYPSTALMTVIPALAAGVQEVAVATPPGEEGEANPAVLAALSIAGVRRAYRVGGAHAAAAMAYGTETVPRVCKIIGPGGSWFTAAKLALTGVVDMEFPAGPTELVVLADSSADPRLVAHDMAAQAEHGSDSFIALVTTSERVAKEALSWLSKLVEELPRGGVVQEALDKSGAVILADSIDEAIELVNEIAPEHLELLVEDPWSVVSKVRNAGSVSVGHATPPALVDYMLGSNHVLPTYSWAKARGGLTVLDYMKPIYVNAAGKLPSHLYEKAALIAREEGLEAHAQSIEARIREL